MSGGKDAKAKAKGTSSSSSAATASSSSSCFDFGGRLTTKPQPLSLVLSDAMLGGLDCPHCQDHVGVVLVIGPGLLETNHLQGEQGSAGCLVCYHRSSIIYDYTPSDTSSLLSIPVCLAIVPGVRSRRTLRRRGGLSGPRAVPMGHMHHHHEGRLCVVGLGPPATVPPGRCRCAGRGREVAEDLRPRLRRHRSPQTRPGPAAGGRGQGNRLRLPTRGTKEKAANQTPAAPWQRNDIR